jgi:hypothetical protein
MGKRAADLLANPPFYVSRFEFVRAWRHADPTQRAELRRRYPVAADRAEDRDTRWTFRGASVRRTQPYDNR